MPSRKKEFVPKELRLYSSSEQYRDSTTGTTIKSKAADVFVPYRNLSASAIRDLLTATIWIENCINVIVDEVVKYPLVVDPADTFPDIEAFLKYPSSVETLYIIRKKYLKDMLRYGNGSAILTYVGNKPTNLSVAPGYCLKVIDTPEKKELLYQFGEANSPTTIRKDSKGLPMTWTQKEVMHFAIDRDSDESLGRSCLERAYNTILADKNLSLRLTDFLNRGLFNPAFLSIEKVNKADMMALLEFMNNSLGDGSKMFGINKKADFKEIPHWKAEEIIKMQQWLGLAIANCYKVPPFMLNLVNDTGSLNAREQKQRFTENVVMPILEYEAQLYTLILVRMGFKNLEASITSTSAGSRLTYDKARISSVLVEKGIITVDEARKTFFNLPPMAGTKPVRTPKK